ncbi:hypothetical protein GF342_04725 [Candidatus Woesearchaeota archaeon]|nr:hypothetical protein [Candidatus Woesearchaeota archaeon]
MGSYPFVRVMGSSMVLYAETAIGDYEDKEKEAKDTREWEVLMTEKLRSLLPKLEAVLHGLGIALAPITAGYEVHMVPILVDVNQLDCDRLKVTLCVSTPLLDDEKQRIKEALERELQRE